ncbi:methyl-accepting chemotaxis protein [Sphingomonas sp. IC081]|uniref:methyl-accepting chemotaxis protein n=2 Tax=Sphingomonadaceae TaxID=41297 RepID=UPI0021AF5396|nr:methyl-accepting chemotaxis protein [Sphingomonas sp. IC081]
MVDWFVKHAPIRQKTWFAFTVMAAAMLVAVLCAALLPLVIGLPAGLALTLGAWLFGMACREGICVPYVSTVVRMEGLAAGDLDSPVDYTDYRDCVGRMTQAMFTFRETARQQRITARDQAAMVEQFTAQLEKLARGDLTAQVTAEFTGEFSQLKSHFNEAIGRLRDLVGAVQVRAQAIRTGSSEISQASDDLARRTEANAASLQQTSAAIVSMEDRLRSTAVAAGQTLESADGVIALVGKGRAVAGETVETMGRVSGCAKGIDTVIEGVDKIAFQTRVLAMNAAVEAGRAGEAGRGFAVVADLVSALAMRAEEEARNAREQLGVTQSEVASAVEAVNSVDSALVEIVDGVGKVHRLLERMTTDNREQSAAITQVTTAIGEMERTTQYNASMVEQTSAAALNLDSEISRLSAQAGEFRLA